MQRLLVAMAIIATATISSGQSVGTKILSELASEKFTLINPVNATDCYLIDNCGFIVKKWSSEYRPGLAAYLDSEGSLYRAGRVSSNIFRAGGLGGNIEKFSWNGIKLWEYSLADNQFHLHHDFFIMSDGKLMLIAWEFISSQELTSLGRIDFPANGQFYSEKILLIDPENNFEEVWSWRAIDHIVQNISDTIPNYGLKSENPRKLDVNLNKELTNNYLDWLHINSIDVNEKDSLILLSCNGIDELIVIEYSKNQEISENSTGGKYGFGGDLLFRWGNPSHFSDDTLVEKRLFSQHDANWAEPGTHSEISVFNNGRREDNQNYSTVDLVSFSDSLEDWIENIGSPEIQNQNFKWSYNDDKTQDLYSKRMSSAHRFGENWVICSSDNGRVIEIDNEGMIVWEYINPVGVNQIFEPSDTPFGNILFGTHSYSEDYFSSNVEIVVSEERIESSNEDCIEIISSTLEETPVAQLRMIGSAIHFNHNESLRLGVYDISGRRVIRNREIENGFCLNLREYPNGLYVLVLRDSDNVLVGTFKYFNK